MGNLINKIYDAGIIREALPRVKRLSRERESNRKISSLAQLITFPSSSEAVGGMKLRLRNAFNSAAHSRTPW